MFSKDLENFSIADIENQKFPATAARKTSAYISINETINRWAIINWTKSHSIFLLLLLLLKTFFIYETIENFKLYTTMCVSDL